MTDTPQALVRLDRGDAAVVEVSGHLEPDGLLELAAVIRRTQRLSRDVVVDVTGAVPGPLTMDLLTELSLGRQGCAPFQVLGALDHASGF
ncbi:hypothetical protein [Cellulomonas xylanilytica]|uniref:Uncharacterized protein n=1 Tax=Cellulomonas xylanilytica TaxID=233583 RepID=A0A510V224_9CELL|nr:hypothetical protein [Cellulomonas xylanilytica]GEK20898.1 hypothetical protein CXY01_14180 [Cellulomonas xylanilytica]